VECAEPQAAGFFTQQVFYPAFHHAGGFIGESHSQDVIGRQMELGDQVSDTVGKNTSLPRTGTGQHKDVTGLGGYRLFLLWI